MKIEASCPHHANTLTRSQLYATINRVRDTQRTEQNSGGSAMSWDHAVHVLHLLSGRWTPAILDQLRVRSLRPYELRLSLEKLPAPKVMHESLMRLEARGIVIRTVVPTSPPGVEYRLTSLGYRLTGLLDELESSAIILVTEEDRQVDSDRIWPSPDHSDRQPGNPPRGSWGNDL